MLGAFKNERLHKGELEFRLEANLFNTMAYTTVESLQTPANERLSKEKSTVVLHRPPK